MSTKYPQAMYPPLSQLCIAEVEDSNLRSRSMITKTKLSVEFSIISITINFL